MKKFAFLVGFCLAIAVVMFKLKKSSSASESIVTGCDGADSSSSEQFDCVESKNDDAAGIHVVVTKPTDLVDASIGQQVKDEPLTSSPPADRLGLLARYAVSLGMAVVFGFILRRALSDGNVSSHSSEKAENSTTGNVCKNCSKTKVGNEWFRLSLCSHKFCRECLAASIVNSIVDDAVRTVQCIGTNCKQPIANEDVVQLVDTEMYEIYTHMSAVKLVKPTNTVQESVGEKQKICVVCTDEKVPSKFYVLKNCGHADFCRECLEQALTVAVVENNVKNLKCLNTDCGMPLDYDEIAKILDPEMFRTFDKLLMETEVVGMADAETCPNAECGLKSFHARSAADATRVTVCPHCRKEFCLVCKAMLNGSTNNHECEQTNPAIRQAVDAYENASASVAERIRLEESYGKTRLQSWIANRQSQRVMDGMKKCPRCRMPTEKTEGCNHMTCKTSGGSLACGAEWCWLCGQIITGPWTAHFNRGACAALLFHRTDLEA